MLSLRSMVNSECLASFWFASWMCYSLDNCHQLTGTTRIGRSTTFTSARGTWGGSSESICSSRGIRHTFEEPRIRIAWQIARSESLTRVKSG